MQNIQDFGCDDVIHGSVVSNIQDSVCIGVKEQIQETHRENFIVFFPIFKKML